MLKICDEAIFTFETNIHQLSGKGVYPNLWKKANVLPIHKKQSRQLTKNYRPISFLLISVASCLKNNTWRNLHAPPRKQFVVPQTIWISTGWFHNKSAPFDHEWTRGTRAVFLDISKALDKVWHEGLISKLKSNGIQGKPLNLIIIFLSNRQQRVVLNGKSSEWKYVSAGVPQGSVPGPLYILVYINDFAEGLVSDVRLFADDTSLLYMMNKSQPIS